MRKKTPTSPNGAVLDCIESGFDLWWIDVCTRKPWTFVPSKPLRTPTVRGSRARSLRVPALDGIITRVAIMDETRPLSHRPSRQRV